MLGHFPWLINGSKRKIICCTTSIDQTSAGSQMVGQVRGVRAKLSWVIPWVSTHLCGSVGLRLKILWLVLSLTITSEGDKWPLKGWLWTPTVPFHLITQHLVGTKCNRRGILIQSFTDARLSMAGDVPKEHPSKRFQNRCNIKSFIGFIKICCFDHRGTEIIFGSSSNTENDHNHPHGKKNQSFSRPPFLMLMAFWSASILNSNVPQLKDVLNISVVRVPLKVACCDFPPLQVSAVGCTWIQGLLFRWLSWTGYHTKQESPITPCKTNQ